MARYEYSDKYSYEGENMKYPLINGVGSVEEITLLEPMREYTTWLNGNPQQHRRYELISKNPIGCTIVYVYVHEKAIEMLDNHYGDVIEGLDKHYEQYVPWFQTYGERRLDNDGIR